MIHYIADDEVILSLEELREVKKEDSQYNDEQCILKWNYKGSDFHSQHVYQKKDKRDAMFDKASAALIRNKED